MFWFGVYVAANVAFITLLALYVSWLRISRRIPHGDGGQVFMKQAIRAHANGVEHVLPFGLVVLALGLVGGDGRTLAALVLGFTAARLLHAWGMLTTVFNARRIGAGLTYLAELAGVLLLVLRLVA